MECSKVNTVKRREKRSASRFMVVRESLRTFFDSLQTQTTRLISLPQNLPPNFNRNKKNGYPLYIVHTYVCIYIIHICMYVFIYIYIYILYILYTAYICVFFTGIKVWIYLYSSTNSRWFFDRKKSNMYNSHFLSLTFHSISWGHVKERYKHICSLLRGLCMDLGKKEVKNGSEI